MGCPCCWPVFSPVHVVNTPVLGTMFQFVRRTPSKSRDCARARNAPAALDVRRAGYDTDEVRVRNLRPVLVKKG